jgi:hypothetical protein
LHGDPLTAEGSYARDHRKTLQLLSIMNRIDRAAGLWADTVASSALARISIAMAGGAAAFALLAASPAVASCRVVGDSVAVGLAAALHPCSVSARIGLSSLKAASRVGHGDEWVIVAIGSNDFPRGISAAQRKLSDTNVRRALSSVEAVAGRRAIVVVPANGGRETVESWLSSHGLRSVSFSAGPDGIHPRSYGELAKRVRDMMAN